MREHFNIFKYKINTRNFIVFSVGILATITLLLSIHFFWVAIDWAWVVLAVFGLAYAVGMYKFIGFKIPLKKLVICAVIVIAVLLLLIGVDLLWRPVSWYGVLIGTGFLLALAVACEIAQYRDLERDYPYDLLWWIFPFSIVGARLYFVLLEIKNFQSFWDIFKIWEGGMAIYGGVIGGFIGVVICCAIKKKDLIKTLDMIAPVLILGQAVGRWGNFINKELYGFVINNPLWQWFPIGVQISGTWHLALFFYESFLNLIGFALLIFLLKKYKTKGIVVSSYLIFYGAVRLSLESLRLKEYILMFWGTNIPFSSIVSGLIIIGGIVSLVLSIRGAKKKKVVPIKNK